MAIRRGEFVAMLGGVMAWPLVAGAQQTRIPRIGYLATGSLNDPDTQVVLSLILASGPKPKR